MCTCTVFNIYTQNEAVTETVLLFANKCGGFLVLFCLVSLASLTVGLQCYSEQCSVWIIFLLVAVGLWLVFFVLLEQSVFFVVLLLDTALKSLPPTLPPPPQLGFIAMLVGKYVHISWFFSKVVPNIEYTTRTLLLLDNFRKWHWHVSRLRIWWA